MDPQGSAAVILPDDLSALIPGVGFDSALIIDDHPLFCEALALTLQLAAGIADLRAAGSLAEALDLLSGDWCPDVVLLDLNLPDVRGLDGLTRILQAKPGLKVLVVSSLTDPVVIRAALQAGARGYVPKHSPRETFRTALATIAGDEVFRPEGLTGDEGISAREEALLRLSQLTPQQSNILRLICAGQMNKQIAWELAIAETTVKAHVTAIMRKLGVQSRTQAVLLAQEARQAGLLPDE